jgi:hypothetical protein
MFVSGFSLKSYGNDNNFTKDSGQKDIEPNSLLTSLRGALPLKQSVSGKLQTTTCTPLRLQYRKDNLLA